MGQVQGAGSRGRRGRGSLPRVDVGTCFGAAADWLRRSVSGPTWTAYAKVWAEWAGFKRLAEVERADMEMGWLVVYFVSRHMEKVGSVSALEKKLAALAFLFKLEGREDFTKTFWVRQAVKGYKKGRQSSDARRPVTFSVLRRIFGVLGEVCSSAYEIRLFRAGFSVAFFGAFRVGELVSPSKRVPGGLLVNDVHLAEGKVVFRLKRSKTDQGGKGVGVSLYSLPGSEACPVGVVREFFKVRPKLGGPFLMHGDGSFVSRFQFTALFRKCLKKAGLDERLFASHSFRIGAATEAARCGLDETAVKRIGRWESRRFRSYVRPHLALDL